MKLSNGRIGLTFRLGAMVAALLLGQQAMAAGVAADTDIANTATVNYQVGGVDQPVINTDPADATFKVDRRVDFTLEPINAALEGVAPGEQDAWVDFRLTNTSNSVLDFKLALAQVAAGIGVGTGTDGADLDNIDFAVALTPESGANLDPVQGTDPRYVNDLPADESIRIRVWGDAALTLANGLVAGAQLTATAADPAGTIAAEGDPLTESANGQNTLENVFAETGLPTDNDGIQIAIDGWIVEAAELTVAKAITDVDDGFGTDHAIPGAIVTYTITVTNASASADATNVVITDTLDSGLVFLDMTLDGVACTEAAPDNDGCVRAGQDLTFDKATVAQGGGTMIVVIRATIDPT